MKDVPFDFYSDKNYVTLDFANQRLLDPKILKNPSIQSCIKKMLALIEQKKISSADAAKVFPEKICRIVYELAAPRDYILSNLKDAIERTRRILFQHLRAHHENDIRQLPEFQVFQSTYNKSFDPVLAFLKQNYRGFTLAEEWGYIKNAKKLIDFQKLRDVPRHPSKFMPSPLDSEKLLHASTDEDWHRWIYYRGYPYQSPKELYDEFQKAFPLVSPKMPQNIISYDDAVCSTWVQADIEQLKKIRGKLPRANQMEAFLKKNFPEDIFSQIVTVEKADKTRVQESITTFSDFYVRGKGVLPDAMAQTQSDGTILLKEKDFHDWWKLSDICAHANPGYQESAKILSEDMTYLSAFVADLTDAFNRKIRSAITQNKTMKCPTQSSGRQSFYP